MASSFIIQRLDSGDEDLAGQMNHFSVGLAAIFLILIVVCFISAADNFEAALSIPGRVRSWFGFAATLYTIAFIISMIMVRTDVELEYLGYDNTTWYVQCADSVSKQASGPWLCG